MIEPSAYAYTEVLAEKVYEYVWDQTRAAHLRLRASFCKTTQRWNVLWIGSHCQR